MFHFQIIPKFGRTSTVEELSMYKSVQSGTINYFAEKNNAWKSYANGYGFDVAGKLQGGAVMALIEGSGMVYWCFLFLRVLGYISGAKLLVDFIWFIVQRFGTNVQINYNINNNNNNNENNENNNTDNKYNNNNNNDNENSINDDKDNNNDNNNSNNNINNNNKNNNENNIKPVFLDPMFQKPVFL